MHRVTKARANRWSELIVLSITGSLFAAFLGTWIFDFIHEFLLKASGSDNYFNGLMYLSGALFIGLGFIHYFVETKLNHIRRLDYPSHLVAVPLSFLGAILWSSPFQTAQNIFHTDWPLAVACAVIYIIVWGLYGWIFYLLRKFAKSDQNESSLASAEYADEPELLPWLTQSEPIETAKDDLFNHRLIAARLAARLDEPGAQSIALLGSYGAGKSSICKMLMEHTKETKKPYIYVTVSCWGFSSSDRVQTVLLEAILTEIAKEVDCLKLRSLPEHYIRAISGHSGWLDSILKLITHKNTPLRQIERLSPILSAIGKRVIVLIEDLDRNQEGFRLSQIQALLMQLKQVEEISFILAISPNQDVDFFKVCNYLEKVDDLPRTLVLELIEKLGTSVIKDSDSLILVGDLLGLFTKEESLILRDHTLHYIYPNERCFYMLLNTPRKLRATMQRVNTVWQNIKGEVQIDDLISMCVLRIAVPEAFRYFQKNWIKIGTLKKNVDGSNKHHRQKVLDEQREEWANAIGGTDFDAEAAGNLICKLCPEFGSVIAVPFTNSKPAQFMANPARRHIYARRLFSESIYGENHSDQSILGSIQRGLTYSDARKELAEVILESQEATDVFENFAREMHFDRDIQRTLELLSHIITEIKTKYGLLFPNVGLPGYYAVWSLLASNCKVEVTAWLKPQIDLCLPGYLNLVERMYYHWLEMGYSEHDSHSEIRCLIYNKLKEFWTNTDVSKIAKIFDDSDPYSLRRIVFTVNYENPDSVPYGNAIDWQWLGPILWKGCQEMPLVFVPQVLGAVRVKREDNRPDPTYEFDREVLSVWFVESTNEFLELVANGIDYSDALHSRTLYSFKLAENEAIKILDKEIL